MFGLRNLLFLSIALLLFGGLNACNDIGYYLQTANGHLKLMAGRKSIPALLKDQNTPEELREKLKDIAEIRSFASERLGLPDNGSYRSYVELDRPYVVWNVVATPEFSLEPLTWCFPFAGCISYRGYFKQEKAREFATGLQDQGYDITLSGVPAYSTLSWFDDPALSTFSAWPTSAIARLIFHELAHQQLYLPDDSAFNESFSSTVELAGVELWLDSFGSPKDKETYVERLGHEKQFIELTVDARQQLKRIYDSALSDQEKRQKKEMVFSDMRHRYNHLKESWNGYSGYDRWFLTLNNAKFAAVNTYHRWVPAFKLVMQQEKNNFPSFYQRCEAMSRLPQQQRRELLDRLSLQYQVQQKQTQALDEEKQTS